MNWINKLITFLKNLIKGHNKMDWKKYQKYFKPAEFVCKCGCNSNDMKQSTLELLYKARQQAGIPFVINSGYRCSKHNKSVGGTTNSAHLRGYAVDIRCLDGNTRYRLIQILSKYFNRIGLHKQFIHVDNDSSLPQNQVFFY